MTKLFKKLSVIFIALCVLTATVFASACNDFGNPAEMGYEITVLYPNGKPVQSTDTGSARNKVNVVLADGEGKALTSETMGVLDAYGTAHIDYKVPGEYTIVVNNVPAGYRYVPEKTSADKARQTVTLLNIQTSYEINVLAPDGTPANGYDVAVMNGTTEMAKGKTNTDGVYKTAEINAGTYSVIVTEATGKIHHKSVMTSPIEDKVTVKTFEPIVITLDDSHKMTQAQLDDWTSANSEELNLIYVNELHDNYLYQAETFGTEETFYIIRAAEKGNYTFNFRPDMDGVHEGNYIVKFYNIDSYDNYDSTLTLNGSENGGRKCSYPLSLDKNEDWIFSVTSRDGREHYILPMAISYHKGPEEQRATGAGDYTLVFNEINEAVLEFSTEVSGKYRISVVGEHENNPKYLEYSNGANKPLGVDLSRPLYEQAESFPILLNYADDFISKDDKGNVTGKETFSYHVFLNEATTTSVKIKIERTGDADPFTPDVETTKVPAPTGLAKQVFTEDYETYTYSWHWLATDGTQTPVEKNGKWVVEIRGTEYDVYVAISKNFAGQIYSFETTEYVGGSEVRPSGKPDNEDGSSDGDQPGSGGVQTDRQNNRLEQVMEVGSTTVAYNYRSFVEEYVKHASKAQAPAGGASEAFTAYANATDGVYALNGDLKAFITRYMEGEWANVVDMEVTTKPAQPWLLACGYLVKTAK